MCRIPKVVIVAPADRHPDLRKTLSSLEYDIVAAVTSAEQASGISADVAIALDPDEATIRALRDLSYKTVAVDGDDAGADMALSSADLASFKARFWELFRPAS